VIVKWKGVALDQLANIYVAATPADRHEIEATVMRINAALAADPWHLGESRSKNRRVWFEYPLTVVFTILPAEQRVLVTHVARLRPRA
jgi:hypothetical protein